MLYAIGFIGLFTIGGLTGLFLAAVGLDVHVTDTYFIIAHFHYIMVGGTIMGYLGGLHYWWPKISGRLYNECLAKLSAGDHLHRLQPDVLPAVRPRLSRHAAALPRVSAGVPGAERAVVGRRVDPRRRLPDSDGLSDVVAALRPARRLEPVGRRRPRVDDDVAAADRELRGDADRDVGGLRLSGARWSTMLPDAAHGRRAPSRRSRTSSTASSSRARRRRSACGCSWSPRCCSSAACSRPTCLPQPGTRTRSPRPATSSSSGPARSNTAVLITSSLTMALAVQAAQTGASAAADDVPVLTMALGRRVPRHQGRRVLHTSSSSTTCPAPDSSSRAILPPGADLLLALLRDDRPARAAHDHRPRHHGR